MNDRHPEEHAITAINIINGLVVKIKDLKSCISTYEYLIESLESRLEEANDKLESIKDL